MELSCQAAGPEGAVAVAVRMFTSAMYYYADATLSVFNGRREIVLLKPNNCTTHKLIREVESDRNLNCSG